MTRTTLPGSPPIEVILRPSARARRVSLRVSALDGRVTVSFPAGYSERGALGFAREKEDWIRRQLAVAPAHETVGAGSTIPLEGKSRSVVAGAGRSIRVADGVIEVPGPRIGVRLSAFLKAMARERLTASCDRYSAALGRGYSSLRLRDTRSRWGSCSSQGALMFSWRLILAPPEVLDYVAAHEVAHLAHMNHGPRFWEAVQDLYGPYAGQRGWLRKHGGSLHRYSFTG